VGSGIYPDLDVLQSLIKAKTANLIALDAEALAIEAGNVLSVNMVLLGALIQTGKIPLSSETVKEAIKTKTKKAFVELNLKAFELGFSAASQLG
jgi:indolepyruvate ferredoxin oxidoreductase beta subunit